MQVKDTILTINVVEPSLVRAIRMHSEEMGIELKGLVLVHRAYDIQEPARLKDTTGLFEEIICDLDDADELQAALKPYQERILGAHCRYESSVLPLRKVIPFLPYIVTPTETSLLWSTEKSQMRDRLHGYDPTLVPRYQSIEAHDVPAIKELVKDFEFPVIVKPADLQASLLVSRCEDMAELETCLKNTFAIIHDIYAREHRAKEPSVLVEEMMQGDMYSVDGYVSPDGEIYCLPLVRVITAHEVGLPGFYTFQTKIPVSLSESDVEAANKVCVASMRALNLRATTTHIELFKTPTGWKIVELGARIGGHRNDLYRESYGIRHFYNDVAVRIGRPPKIPTELLRHAAGMQMYAEEEGVIESIEGLDEARKLSSIVWLEAHNKPGDEVLFAHNAGHTVVDGILSNEDLGLLEQDIAKVRELVKINVKK